MGKVKIPYYVTRLGGRMGYWTPCLARPNKETGKMEPTLMAKLGFEAVPCGPDGPAAWATAQAWNEKWKAARAAYLAGVPIKNITTRERVFLTNSLGEAFARFRKTNAWNKDKKPRTQEDWWRAWVHIEEWFGNTDPQTISLREIDVFYQGDPEHPKAVPGLVAELGIREAHRVMKIWRALWSVIGTIERDDGGPYVTKKDPSLGIRVKNPKGRSAIWLEGEAVRIIKGAIRLRFYGLAAALAVAWDSSLSPVDVRTLTKAQLTGDAEGPFFTLDRAKTGQPAIATFSKRTQRLLAAYMTTLPPDLIPSAPIFMTRGGAAAPADDAPDGPSRPMVRLLDALAFFHALGELVPTRAQIAEQAGYSATSSGFEALLREARTSGLVDYPAAGRARLTASGEALAREVAPRADEALAAGGRGGNRGGGPRKPVPYTADTYGDDFREVREAVFPGDTRKMLDFRRGGAVEALAGGYEKGTLNAKMANTVEDNPELARTYLPNQVAVVRLADEARKRGRARLRGGNGSGSKS